jgi:hypothetical protein
MGEWEFTIVVTMKTRGFAVETVEVRMNYKNLSIFMNAICKYAAVKEIVFNLFVRYWYLFVEFIQQATNLQEYKKYFLTF